MKRENQNMRRSGRDRKDRQIVSENWVKSATSPGDVYPGYGCMWHLNNNLVYLPSAPETVFMSIGCGSNRIYVDPMNDLVIVVRWFDGSKFDTLVEKVLSFIKTRS